MVPNHTIEGWLIGLVLISGVAGAVITPLFTWALYRYLDYCVSKKQWALPRKDRERNWPFPFVVGVFERIVFTVMVAFWMPGVAAAIMLWISLKLVAGWARLTPNGPAYRQLALTGVLCGLISLGIAVLGGLVAGGYI